ncbi:hypothetical protein CSW28_07770 [Thermus scotoductus]|nr:hypothetical protein CSW28_07770 [Thermus scotoductus]
MYRYNHYVWGAPLTPNEKLVLLYLLDRSNEEGLCWPSITTIAASTGLSRRGVQNVLHRLRDLGLIAWRVAESASRLPRRRVKAFTKTPRPWPPGRRGGWTASRPRPTPRTGPWPCGRCGRRGSGIGSKASGASPRTGGPGTSGFTGPWPATFGAWEARSSCGPWGRPSRGLPPGPTSTAPSSGWSGSWSGPRRPPRPRWRRPKTPWRT